MLELPPRFFREALSQELRTVLEVALDVCKLLR
jgi:hypothetical protein